MQKPVLLILMIFTASIAIMGCAQTSKNINQEVMAETTSNSEQLSAEAHNLIDSNPSFTPDQKQKLLALHKRTHEVLTELREETYKLRALLLEKLTTGNSDTNEVSSLRGKLEYNENQKLQTYFSALDQVNEILGRESPQSNRQEIMEAMDDSRDRHDHHEHH